MFGSSLRHAGERRRIRIAVAAVTLTGGLGFAAVPSLAGAATTCAEVEVVVHLSYGRDATTAAAFAARRV